MNVSTRTSSALVYGETGRYPFYVNIYTRYIKYWPNLVRMPDNRLPSKSYKMLYDLHCKNKNNWVSYVCFTLYRYGFGFVWEHQGVCNTKRLFCEFRQRLIDCCLQDWYSAMASKDRLADYLFPIKKAVLRKHLVRFRLIVSPLKTRRLRYSERTPDIFTCPFCDTNESEIHFLLVCPKYKTLRETYLPVKFYNRPSAFKVAVLSTCNL